MTFSRIGALFASTLLICGLATGCTSDNNDGELNELKTQVEVTRRRRLKATQ